MESAFYPKRNELEADEFELHKLKQELTDLQNFNGDKIKYRTQKKSTIGFVNLPALLSNLFIPKFVSNINHQSKIKNLSKRIANKKALHYKNIDRYLSLNDEIYYELANKNYQLLQNEFVKLSRYSSSVEPFNRYSIRQAGKIDDNGFLHIHTIERAISGKKGDYPSVLVGEIDHLGYAEFVTEDVEYNPLGSLPKHFYGYIGEAGQTFFKISDSQSDFLGASGMDKLVCDPFSGSELKREAFLKNRVKLLQSITNFRKELVKSLKPSLSVEL